MEEKSANSAKQASLRSLSVICGGRRCAQAVWVHVGPVGWAQKNPSWVPVLPKATDELSNRTFFSFHNSCKYESELTSYFSLQINHRVREIKTLKQTTS